MKFNSISFRVALCTAILGFSVSCGNTDPSTSTAEGDNWTELPYGVKAYVAQQICSGREVISSSLAVDFQDAQLADGITPEQIASNPIDLYCGEDEEDCRQYEIAPGNKASVYYRQDSELPNAKFFDITEQNFEVKLIAKIEFINDQNNLQTLPLIDSAITVNFPNTVCGDGRNTQCEDLSSHCPESHRCTFDYDDCRLESSTCASGYEERDIEDQDGSLFNGLRCAEATSN